MKWLSALIVIAGLAVLGYLYRDQIFKKNAGLSIAPAVATPAPLPTGPAGTPTPAAPLKPQSKVARGTHLAPAGVFYMIERVSMTTSDGIAALNVADHVLLVQKLPGGKMKVMDDNHNQFVVKESQATNDLDLAREAEEKDFRSRPGSELVPKL
jgi:hypothetical protein